MKHWSPLFFFVITLFSTAHTQSVWLEETFDKADARWFQPSQSQEWSLTGSELRCETKGYDQLLASSFYALGTTPYSFEALMRGARAGIYFHLDNSSSKAFSHMIRFDDQSILTGYFNGAGEYRATNTFESPVPPSSWLTLRIDIDPVQGRYRVFVNGTLLGVDTIMTFRSGYLGLQASDGISEFRSVRVFGPVEQKPIEKASVGEKVQFQHVRYVQTEGRNVRIYNPETQTLQTLDESGTLKRDLAVKEVPEPQQQVSVGNHSFSIQGSVISVRDSKGGLVDSIGDQISAPSSLLAGEVDGNPVLYVADPGANAVMMFDKDRNLLKTFKAVSIGGFKGPLSLDRYGKETLVIADYDRLIFVSNTLEEIQPSVHMLSPSEATIEWPRLSDAESFVSLSGRDPIASGRSADGRSLSARVNGLHPFTRYSYRVSPALKTIPLSASVSKSYRLTTPPADPSMMAYTRLPLLYMVYKTISYRDRYPKDRFPNIPGGRTLTEGEIEYLRQATEFNRSFYFRNSSCRLLLDFDFYVVEDTLWLHEVGEKDPYWLSPNDRVAKDFENAAAHFGRKPEEYVGLLCPYAWVNYPPRRRSAMRDPSTTDTINIRQAYGGGTYGVPAPWRYGKTAGYTGNPFQDVFSRQDWLITHEFHHQVDALMEASGVPEYYHCDLPWKMPGRFGEDFDFNAHIMRLATKEDFLGLAFGSLEQTQDEDHDGVPDDDPALPFDELRMNGNSSRQDTDGDGLSDLDEVLAGTSRGTELNNRDSDMDGLPDGADPEPLYPFNGTITRGDASTLIGSIREKELRADVFAGWDDRYLTIRYEANRPANMLVQLDGEADGWFHGFDNVQSRILAYEDSVSVADFYLRDCASWIQSPHDRRDILKRTDLLVRLEKKGGMVIVTARIPAIPDYHLNLGRGKKLGMRIGLQTATDLWVWHELFERNYMMEVELR